MKKYELLKNIKEKEDKILCSYIIDKYFEYRKKNITTYSQFLDKRELNLVLSILNKLTKEYQIYFINEYCEKSLIVFGNLNEVKVSCLEIKSNIALRHQDYLGSLFSLGIDRHIFGDIIIDGNIAYLFIFNKIKDYITKNLILIGNQKVNIKEIDFNTLKISKEKFERLNINVSSIRIDVIISKLINKSRKESDNLISKGKVLINYSVLKRVSYFLQENDVFSITGYGKYIYRGIINKTKKGNNIVIIDKYN